MSKDDQLINSLSRDLQPVKPVPAAGWIAAFWMLISVASVMAMTHWAGPLRSNALAQLAVEPRFLLETIVGLAAIGSVGLLAFRSAVPGREAPGLASVAALLMLLWLASYVVGLAYPALEPSMLGKRPHCFAETLVYALPPIALAVLLVRRLYPLRPLHTAFSFSLAAGMMPALYMQLACMYVPSHILQYHIAPGLFMAAAGAALARILRR